MSTTNVVILGAAGRMGQALIRCAQRMPDVRATAAIEQAGHPQIGTDAGVIAGLPALNLAISSDYRGALARADAVIDFTLHTATVANATVAVELGKPMVIGTTGLTPEEAARIREFSRKIPIVWAPNMSLGVNLLFSLVRKAAEILQTGYRIEVDETHHIHKKDAPSGTALRLAEKVAEGLGTDLKSAMVHIPDPPEGGAPAQAQGRIVVRSHRRGEVVGDHTVSFENDGERIEFTHLARNRESFAGGALYAAQWVKGRAPGLYDMQNVLGL